MNEPQTGKRKKKQIIYWHTEKCTLFARFGLKDVFGLCGLMNEIKNDMGFRVTMKRAESGKIMNRTLSNKIEIESEIFVCFDRKDIRCFDNITLDIDPFLAKKN